MTVDERETLQQQIDALRAEVADLRSQLWTGGPRLGPRPETPDEIQARADRMTATIERLRNEGTGIKAEAPPVDRSKLCTTNGAPVEEVRANQQNETGQHEAYIVLCPEERAKGFVRPYRDSYKHVGRRPTYPVRDLTAEQHERYDLFGYVKFEEYPPDSPESQGGTSTGRYWTAADLKSGCGTVTTMGRALSETYARDPSFYGSTLCVRCDKHLPVAEFVWTADGQQVGS